MGEAKVRLLGICGKINRLVTGLTYLHEARAEGTRQFNREHTFGACVHNNNYY